MYIQSLFLKRGYYRVTLNFLLRQTLVEHKKPAVFMVFFQSGTS